MQIGVQQLRDFRVLNAAGSAAEYQNVLDRWVLQAFVKDARAHHAGGPGEDGSYAHIDSVK
ncbi:hypothetical protein GCM10011495_08780 [Hymenobacter frigidus]|uniref:Uncharacterized protein n=1 Tax=Hymenobacter frigidus TaxID=1524095 RepID=A0ABQ1ZX97_9BACT|nr:hypothetical protein GCM10011495_08780 [Hymenobacter frigidus]